MNSLNTRVPDNVREVFRDKFRVYYIPIMNKTVRIIVPLLPDLEVKFVEVDSEKPKGLRDILTLPLEEYRVTNVFFHREDDFRVYSIPEEFGYFCPKIELTRQNPYIYYREHLIPLNAGPNVPVTVNSIDLPTKYFSIKCLNMATTLCIELPRGVIPIAMLAAFTAKVKPTPAGHTPTPDKTGKCGIPNCPERNHGYLSTPFFSKLIQK